MFGGGALQVVLTVGAVTVGSALLAGVDVRTGIYTGCLIALSSTAVVLKLLSSKGKTGSPTGQVSVAFLIFQDIAVVVMVLVVPLLGQGGGSLWDVVLVLAKSAVIIVVVVLGTRRVVPRALAAVSTRTNDEEFLLAILAIADRDRVPGDPLRAERLARGVHRRARREQRPPPVPCHALRRALPGGVRGRVLRLDRHAAGPAVPAGQPRVGCGPRRRDRGAEGRDDRGGGARLRPAVARRRCVRAPAGPAGRVRVRPGAIRAGGRADPVRRGRDGLADLHRRQRGPVRAHPRAVRRR